MKRAISLPAHSYLKECFLYDKKSGILTWNPNRPKEHFSTKRGHTTYLSRYAGNPAGRAGPEYFQLQLCGKNYQVHRIIWMLVTGEDPGDREIDHKNRDGFNNRWRNLRLATLKQNARNKAGYGASGVKNVYPRSGGRFQVMIRVDGKLKSLGYFNDIGEASRIATRARTGLHKQFANHD